MKIRYNNKQTRALCEYVTIHPDDMKRLITTATIVLSQYAEMTADSTYLPYVTHSDPKRFGKRGNAPTAPRKANNRLSILGGVIYNYYTKDPAYRNDLTKQQLPYIEAVINEHITQMNIPAMTFTLDFF